jgi:hypothetical protein
MLTRHGAGSGRHGRMRGRLHRPTAALLTLVVALLVAAPAGAKEKPEKDAVAVAASGEGLAPGAPAWVRDHVAEVTGGKAPLGPVSRSLSGTKRASWYGCKTVWAYRGYNHWLGYTLFRYYEQVSWCSNGLSIYSYGRDRWPETHVGWRFNGHIGSSITGGSTSRSAWTQGSFSFCVGGCYDHKYPWVLIDVNVNGGWNAYTGG